MASGVGLPAIAPTQNCQVHVALLASDIRDSHELSEVKGLLAQTARSPLSTEDNALPARTGHLRSAVVAEEQPSRVFVRPP